MHKGHVSLFLTFNILNCAHAHFDETPEPNASIALASLSISEDPRLPKDPDLKKILDKKNINNTIHIGGKYYKFIHVIVQKKALEYYDSSQTRENLLSATTEQDVPNLLSIITLVGKCMSHIYKLNGD